MQQHHAQAARQLLNERERLTARFAPTKRSGELIQENPENNRFRVPIHFGTNRLTFKQIPIATP